MIDLRDVRNLRDDWVVLAAVTLSFTLGAVASGTDSTGSIVAAPLAVGVGVFSIWYFDEVARIPDVDRREASTALREAADELDELDRLAARERAEAEREAEREDELDEAVVVEGDELNDLAARSGLDDEAIAADDVEDDRDDEDDPLSELGLDVDDEAVEHVDDDTLNDFVDLLTDRRETDGDAVADGGETA